MAASQNLSRLRDQTMSSLQDEEAVTVNTRALIDKVLARYSGEWTTLRELIQNAADARARKVTIRFETLSSATIPLPQTSDTADHLKHILINHTLRTMIVSNDGDIFGENDWQRLKRIAEGNPDETKIGAFGVGFYSVFADCESPFVSSGAESMAFYWKKDSLFTRRGKLPVEKTAQTHAQGTTFMLDYRNQTTPIPALMSLCQFLATSLTFVGLEVIELWLDDWNILTLNKKMAPAASVKIPSDVNPKARDGLMKVTNVESQNAQIDAKWMNVVGWDRKSLQNSSTPAAQSDSGGISLRGFFGRFTAGVTNSATTRAAQRAEEALQQKIVEDLAGYSKATVFIRISTVSILTNVSKQLAQELLRATKKPCPKTTRISILTSSSEETTASLASSSGSSSERAGEIFASVIPTKNGKIFIGFPTAQTTGLLAHISAPSVIPTVERESIDLNARYVRDWNIEMLRIAGIACRIAYTGEMVELKNKLDRLLSTAGRRKVTPEDISAVMPSAIHIYKQFAYSESTPSSKVGQYIEEAFWTCNHKASIDVLSTRGVLPSQQVRVATEDLSFVDGIPVIPDELMDKALQFLTKLRDYGFLSDITTGDIKKELESQALSEKQVTELVKWAATKVARQDMDAKVVLGLFDGTVAGINEEFLTGSSSPVLQLGQVKSFVNSVKIPVDLPTPPQTIPFRFTKGLTPSQLQSIGWEELQVVPWVRWIIESDGQGFGEGQSLTTTPAVASQILPVISRAWDGLSQSSKQTIQELFIPRTVIPTKSGMKKPPEAYFGNVKLFDDLPTIVGLQGVKEKFLSSLGVRKTVELGVVFERLMAKSTVASTGEGKWSHVDLIKYLLSVKDDIPSEDIKRLRQTPMCPAEGSDADDAANKSKLYRLSELHEPDDAIRRLKLPVLQWPGHYRATSPEGRFLRLLGLQTHPTVPDLVGILRKAPVGSELQQNTLTYWITNAYHNGYIKYPLAEISEAFLPTLPFAGESNNLVAKPSQCYANPRAAVLRFRTLREDLQPHHAIFGVAWDPPIEACAQRLINAPPADETSAQKLYGYFAGRLNEIGPNGNLAEHIGNALIVPISDGTLISKPPRMRYVAPRAVYLGDGKTYGDVFDFVDFGHEANTFLLRVGSKHEPSAIEIADMLVRQPSRLLDTIGVEKYLQILRKIGEHAASLKKDKTIWRSLKSSPCLLAEKLVPSHANEKHENDEEEAMIKEYSLARASEMVVVDDFQTYRLFQDNLLAGPQEEALEDLYASLETPLLSRLVEDNQRLGQLLRDQSAGGRLQMLLVERCRLFLHDHTSAAIRHDAKWLEQNLSVQVVEFLQITRRLKGYKMQFVEKRTAALHSHTLYVTARFDLYEVSRALAGLLLKRPRQQDLLALETIMESDLRRLKTKGYNVDRILRQKAAESRIADSERQQREEQQRRLIEAESATRPAQATAARSAQAALPQSEAAPETPKQPSMPGAFTDSPEIGRPGSSGNEQKSTSFYNTISKHLGINTGGQAQQHMQKMINSGLSNDRSLSADVPPPYEARDTSGDRTVAPGTERVTSPRDVQSNLTSAINASREYSKSNLFSAPQTKTVKETPSYCDHSPAQDIQLISELNNGFRLYLSRDHKDPNAFLRENRDAIANFVFVLQEVANVFELPAKTINIYHDFKGAAIAFNSNGSLFCNLRYFLQLHAGAMSSSEGKVEAMAYWWITLCHELAHNLVKDHSSDHSYYTESFAASYFRRMVWLAGRFGNQQGV